MTDLTQRPGNPANGLNLAYQELMSISDPGELQERAIEIVGSYEGHGVSKNGATKFRLEMTRLTCLEKMQFYVTNFMMKAAGLGVI